MANYNQHPHPEAQYFGKNDSAQGRFLFIMEIFKNIVQKRRRICVLLLLKIVAGPRYIPGWARIPSPQNLVFPKKFISRRSKGV